MLLIGPIFKWFILDYSFLQSEGPLAQSPLHHEFVGFEENQTTLLQ